MAAATSLVTFASAAAAPVQSLLNTRRSNGATAMAVAMARRGHQSQAQAQVQAQTQSEGALYCRRNLALLGVASLITLAEVAPAKASLEEDYSKETKDVINQVKITIDLEKSNPNASAAVAALRETSNSWVAKYRREKQLAGKPSFSNMYSVLNAISGHYISFGPTSPIPAKRKARILEEMDVAEKALSKGRLVDDNLWEYEDVLVSSQTKVL